MNQEKTKGKSYAMTSFILGMVSLMCCLTSIPAIIFGHLALNRIKKSPDAENKIYAVTGLTVGYITLWFLIGFIFLHAMIIKTLTSVIVSEAPRTGKKIEVKEVRVQIGELEKIPTAPEEEEIDPKVILLEEFSLLVKEEKKLSANNAENTDKRIALYKDFLQKNQDYPDDLFYQKVKTRLQKMEERKKMFEK